MNERDRRWEIIDGLRRVAAALEADQTLPAPLAVDVAIHLTEDDVVAHAKRFEVAVEDDGRYLQAVHNVTGEIWNGVNYRVQADSPTRVPEAT